METPNEPPDGGQEEQHERDQVRPVPRIYVVSLGDYNYGRLHGAWIDAAQDPYELWREVQSMLFGSVLPNAEEFAIQASDGFGPLRLDQHERLETVSIIATGIARYGTAFAHWVNLVGTKQPADLERFQEQYEGHYESLAAYAEQLLADLNFLDELDTFEAKLPQSLRPYVRLDIEAFALDLLYGGDIMTSEGDGGIYVFRPL
jgi:antirestriction protein